MERQPFSCVAWAAGDVRLSVGGRAIPAVANPFSPSCDLAGRGVLLGTPAELEAADLCGAVAILYGALTQEVVSRLGSPVYLPPAHRALAETLIARQPAAVVTVSPTLGGLLPVLEDWELPVPSVTVAAEDALALLGEGAQFQLQIAAQRTPAESWNVISRSAGRPRLVIAAHYDTKHGTPGAVDNASGVAVLLTLARRLAAQGVPGLEFVAFSGEEYGLGGDTYLQSHGLRTLPFGAEPPEREPSTLDGLVAMINIDGVGQTLGTTLLGVLAASPALEQLVLTIAATRPGMVVRDPGPASNHYDFYSHGVPSIVLSSIGLGNLIHLPRDTPQWVSAAKLGEVIEVAETLVQRLGSFTPAATRPAESS